MHAPAAAQETPSATMASTVSGMPGWRLRLHGPFRAASIQIFRIGTLAQEALPTIAEAPCDASPSRQSARCQKPGGGEGTSGLPQYRAIHSATGYGAIVPD